HGHEVRSTVRSEKAAISEQTFGARILHRPLHRLERVVVRTDQSGKVEVARAIVFESRKCCMFGENLAGVCEGKGVRESHASRHFSNDPPVRPRLAGRGQEWTLP